MHTIVDLDTFWMLQTKVVVQNMAYLDSLLTLSRHFQSLQQENILHHILFLDNKLLIRIMLMQYHVRHRKELMDFFLCSDLQAFV